jgi:hypothetical protein
MEYSTPGMSFTINLNEMIVLMSMFSTMLTRLEKLILRRSRR